jgi:hypothetical protein
MLFHDCVLAVIAQWLGQWIVDPEVLGSTPYVGIHLYNYKPLNLNSEVQ